MRTQGIPRDQAPLLDWAVATATLAGESVSGDLSLVKAFPGGTLAAVVDGLGHGAQAAEAARTAIGCMDSCAHEKIISIVQRCHRGLAHTRGVVLSAATFLAAEATMTWIGIGDVAGILLRADPAADPPREVILSRGGVVGYQLPLLRAEVMPIARGDTLILATDGVRSGFWEGLSAAKPPKGLADGILARFAKTTDDALVLVARYLGPER